MEINIGPVDVLVRDTKNRSDAFLAFNYAEWQAHVDAIGNGEHRLPGDHGVTRAELHSEIARLSVEVEKLRAALRHPSSRTKAS